MASEPPGAVAFLLRAYRLKDEPREGWRLRGVREPESVADHSWGTAFLCLLFTQEAGLDLAETMAMALVHDLAEAVTGDVPGNVRFRGSPSAREQARDAKARREREALEQLLQERKAPVLPLWQAYERRGTPEARFVADMNLIDMSLQALLYMRQGRAEGSEIAQDSLFAEFLESAGDRLTTAVGRRLFLEVEKAFRGGPRSPP